MFVKIALTSISQYISDKVYIMLRHEVLENVIVYFDPVLILTVLLRLKCHAMGLYYQLGVESNSLCFH